MKKLTLSILLVALMAPFVRAQEPTNVETAHWSLGLKGGISYYDFTSRYDESWRFGWHGGLVLEYTINPLFGFGLDAGYYNYDKDGEANEIDFKNQTIDGVIYGSVNLANLLSPARRGTFWRGVNFYANVGGGVGVYNYNIGEGESDFKVSPLAMAGLTMEVNLGRSWAVNLGADYRWHFKDNLSGYNLNKTTESVNATLGLRYKFNSYKKQHVRNMTTEAFYPTQMPAPVVVVDETPNVEVMNRLRSIESTTNANKQKIQDLEQRAKQMSQAGQNMQNQMNNMNTHPDPIANLVIEHINFGLNKKELNATDRAILDQAATMLLNNMNAWKSLEIAGYTDATGTEATNLNLSEIRAKLVANYLISKGISASRITSVKGFGSIKPIASNSTVDGRNMNRRVEVTVIK